MLSFQLRINANWCYHWPYIKICFNDSVVFDSEIDQSIDVAFDVDDILDNNQLTINHYGKRSGENKIWDTKVDANGSIVNDCTFQIVELSINGIPFNEIAFKKYLFKNNQNYDNIYLNSIVGFNGEFNISIPKDLYSWLTIIKFKHDIVSDGEQFSNSSQLFHYEEDVKLIRELKTLLDLN